MFFFVIPRDSLLMKDQSVLEPVINIKDNLLLFNEVYLDLKLSREDVYRSSFNESLFESFTEYIILSGIHGLNVSFNSFTGLMSSRKSVRFRRVSILFKLAFLPYNQIKHMYPKLLKLPILLPVAWILRVIDLTFKDRKRRVLRLKHLYSNNTLIDRTSEMFGELGI